MDVLKLQWLICVAMVTVLLCVLMSPVESCSCLRSPQYEQFCRQDFVVKARVRKNVTDYDIETNPMQNQKFSIKVIKILQISEKFQNASKKFVYTSSMESTCGISLKTSTKYLLSGKIYLNQLRVNICDWNVEWNRLKQWEKRGVLHKYKAMCQREITTHILP